MCNSLRFKISKNTISGIRDGEQTYFLMKMNLDIVKVTLPGPIFSIKACFSIWHACAYLANGDVAYEHVEYAHVVYEYVAYAHMREAYVAYAYMVYEYHIWIS